MKNVLHKIDEDLGWTWRTSKEAWLKDRVQTGIWMAQEYLAAIGKLNEPR